MLTIRTPLTAILIFASALPTRAQWQDYIVTLNNDTVYGDLRFRFSMPYKLETGQTDYPIDIKSIESWFSASHKTLARRRMLPGKNKYIFLPVLETGAITLYVNTSPNGANAPSTVTFYAQKRDSSLVEVWTNRGRFAADNKIGRQVLATLIADNAAVKQTLDSDTKYDAIDAQYYIHEYNQGAAAPANP
jgi:hypothetical protein